MPYRKYVFGPAIKQKVKLSKSDAKILYHEAKTDNHAEVVKNGLFYHVVDASWVMRWRAYMADDNSKQSPGIISNTGIAEIIQNSRYNSKYVVHDNNIDLK
jgi:hypothetical protein